MTEYNAQTAEALRLDFEFLRWELEGLRNDLRQDPSIAEEEMDLKEFDLRWLVERRASEYGIDMPAPTNANILVVGTKIMRETSRLHSKQMVAKIRENIERKGKE